MMTTSDYSKLAPHSLKAIFDISNACNCRCIMCHRQLLPQSVEPVKFMPPDRFKAIVSSLFPYLGKLTLSAASEPLTSPYFIELLGILNQFEKVPHTNFLTNGILLDKEYAHAIVDSPVSEVCFSVHGATPQTYAHIIRGASLKKLTRNIHYLSSVKARRRNNTPKLHFNVTIMKSNIAELEKIVELAASLGVQSIAVRHLLLYKNLGLESESLVHAKETTNYWLDRALQKAAALDISVLNFPDFFSLGKQTASPEKQRSIKTLVGRFFKGRPFGFIDTPECNNFFDKKIRLSGWAMSRAAIDRVEIYLDLAEKAPLYRRNDKGLLLLGTAGFHNGMRPDVAAMFPGVPLNNRAGWTFSRLYSKLPFPQKHRFRILAIAYDSNENRRILGARVFVHAPGKNLQTPKFCSHPFDSIYIDNHEQVYPHPDCNTQVPFGSLLTESVQQIWGNTAFADLRSRIAEGCPPSMCKGCAEFINRAVDADAFFAPRQS